MVETRDNEHEELRRAIRKAGRARKRAEEARRAASRDLSELFAKGSAIGLTVAEMERLGEVSREGFYLLRRRAE